MVIQSECQQNLAGKSAEYQKILKEKEAKEVRRNQLCDPIYKEHDEILGELKRRNCAVDNW
jgi:hypothetical protein